MGSFRVCACMHLCVYVCRTTPPALPSSAPFPWPSTPHMQTTTKTKKQKVAEALRQGFQEGRLPARCTGSNSSSSTNSSDGRADVEVRFPFFVFSS